MWAHSGSANMGWSWGPWRGSHRCRHGLRSEPTSAEMSRDVTQHPTGTRWLMQAVAGQNLKTDESIFGTPRHLCYGKATPSRGSHPSWGRQTQMHAEVTSAPEGDLECNCAMAHRFVSQQPSVWRACVCRSHCWQRTAHHAARAPRIEPRKHLQHHLRQCRGYPWQNVGLNDNAMTMLWPVALWRTPYMPKVACQAPLHGIYARSIEDMMDMLLMPTSCTYQMLAGDLGELSCFLLGCSFSRSSPWRVPFLCQLGSFGDCSLGRHGGGMTLVEGEVQQEGECDMESLHTGRRKDKHLSGKLSATLVRPLRARDDKGSKCALLPPHSAHLAR